MHDLRPGQFPPLDAPCTLLYLGSSMNPTLLDLDIVQFVPYQSGTPRIGDIVAIQRHEDPETKIIHRVISLSGEGIRTQGDNNNQRDTWILYPSEILGCVTRVRRGNRTIRIRTGRWGYMVFLSLRGSAWMQSGLKKLVKYPYRWHISSEICRTLLSPFLTSQTVLFSGSARSEIHLYLGPFYAGRLQKGDESWEIRPPFHLFIDPDTLPTEPRVTTTLEGGKKFDEKN